MVGDSRLHVYMIDDGEEHWILADSPEDATECFYETYCSKESERADFELSEPKIVDQDAVSIKDDESGGKRIPLRQVVKEHMERGVPTIPAVLASTVF